MLGKSKSTQLSPGEEIQETDTSVVETPHVNLVQIREIDTKQGERNIYHDSRIAITKFARDTLLLGIWLSSYDDTSSNPTHFTAVTPKTNSVQWWMSTILVIYLGITVLNLYRKTRRKIIKGTELLEQYKDPLLEKSLFFRKFNNSLKLISGSMILINGLLNLPKPFMEDPSQFDEILSGSAKLATGIVVFSIAINFSWNIRIYFVCKENLDKALAFFIVPNFDMQEDVQIEQISLAVIKEITIFLKQKHRNNKLQLVSYGFQSMGYSARLVGMFQIFPINTALIIDFIGKYGSLVPFLNSKKYTHRFFKEEPKCLDDIIKNKNAFRTFEKMGLKIAPDGVWAKTDDFKDTDNLEHNKLRLSVMR